MPVFKRRTASHSKPVAADAVPPFLAGKVPCEKCPLRGMHVLRDFSAKELDFRSSAISNRANSMSRPAPAFCFKAPTARISTPCCRAGRSATRCCPDGRRQILNFALPSDFLGLQGTVANEMQHSVEALTDMILCVFPREKLWDLYHDYPALAFDVTWLAAREEQILDENLLSVGRRTAIERMAYLLCIFSARGGGGAHQGQHLQFPFTQQHVADTLGMSLVHTNKTLKRLSATKTMRWKDRVFEILDREALAQDREITRCPSRAQAAVHLSASVRSDLHAALRQT